MDTLRLVLVTIPKDEARSMAKALVEAKLAACVNIVGEVESFFFWQDAIHNDKEAMLIIKTTSTRFAELSEHIRENHPYVLPEIISFDIAESSSDYANWIRHETKAD